MKTAIPAWIAANAELAPLAMRELMTFALIATIAPIAANALPVAIAETA